MIKLFNLVKAQSFTGDSMSVRLQQRSNTMADRAKLAAHAKLDALKGKAKYSCDREHLI